MAPFGRGKVGQKLRSAPFVTPGSAGGTLQVFQATDGDDLVDKSNATGRSEREREIKLEHLINNQKLPNISSQKLKNVKTEDEELHLQD